MSNSILRLRPKKSAPPDPTTPRPESVPHICALYVQGDEGKKPHPVPASEHQRELFGHRWRSAQLLKMSRTDVGRFQPPTLDLTGENVLSTYADDATVYVVADFCCYGNSSVTAGMSASEDPQFHRPVLKLGIIPTNHLSLLFFYVFSKEKQTGYRFFWY